MARGKQGWQDPRNLSVARSKQGWQDPRISGIDDLKSRSHRLVKQNKNYALDHYCINKVPETAR